MSFSAIYEKVKGLCQEVGK